MFYYLISYKVYKLDGSSQEGENSYKVQYMDVYKSWQTGWIILGG